MDDIDRSILREAQRIDPRVNEGLEVTFRKVRSRQRRRRVSAGIVGVSVPALVLGVGWLTLGPSPGAGPAEGASTPGPSRSVVADPCAWLQTGGPVPDGYVPGTRNLEAQLDRDGAIDTAEVLTDAGRPEGCRFVLRAGMGAGSELVAVIDPLDWPGTAPEVLMAAELDGRPGSEVVVDLSPAAVYRPGAVFTVRDGALVRMELDGVRPADLFPLDDEFPAGVDCTSDAGTIVVTSGTFAEGGTDDGRWEITRTKYRAADTMFEPVGTERFVVDVGSEAERWPELSGEPFRGCPFVNGASDRTQG
jgi:hypothetical protein